MKSVIKLNVFVLKYVPLLTIEDQTLANFLAQLPCVEVQDPIVEPNLFITQNWTKVGVIIINPQESLEIQVPTIS